MTDREIGSADWPSRAYWVITAVVGIVGVGLVTRGFYLDLARPPRPDAPDLIGAGSTLLAAALAGVVTRAGFVTWREQRRRDRESLRLKHQEEVYEEILKHMVTRFTGATYDIKKDAELRASAVVWADLATIRALGTWQKRISEVLVGSASQGEVSLSDSQSKALKTALAEVALAVRKDLQGRGVKQPSAEEILDAVFNHN